MATKPAHLEEIQNTFDGISNFFSEEMNYISGSSSTPASTSSIMALSSYNLDTVNSQGSADGTDYSSGSNQEASSTLASIRRELSMAMSTKAEIFLSHQSELEKEADFYKNQGAYFYGVSSGSPTNGSVS